MAFECLHSFRVWWNGLSTTPLPNPFASSSARESAEYRHFIWTVRDQWVALRRNIWKELGSEKRLMEKYCREVADSFQEGLQLLRVMFHRAVYAPRPAVDVSTLPGAKYGPAARKEIRANRIRISTALEPVKNALTWIDQRKSQLGQWRADPWVTPPIESIGIPRDRPEVPDAHLLFQVVGYNGFAHLFTPPSELLRPYARDSVEETVRVEFLRRWELWTQLVPMDLLVIHQRMASSAVTVALTLDRIFQFAGIGDEFSMKPEIGPQLEWWQSVDPWIIQLHGSYRAWLRAKFAKPVSDEMLLRRSPYPPTQHVRPNKNVGSIGLRSPATVDIELHGFACFVRFLIEQLAAWTSGSGAVTYQGAVVRHGDHWKPKKSTEPESPGLPLRASNLKQCQLSCEFGTSGFILRVSVDGKKWLYTESVTKSVRRVVDYMLDPKFAARLQRNDIDRFCKWFAKQFLVPGGAAPLVRQGKNLIADWKLIEVQEGSSKELLVDPKKLDLGPRVVQ